MYEPLWEGPIEGYTANFIHKNLWKIARSHDREDAWQEARLVFLRCSARYQVDEPKHFMALYQRMLGTHWVDLAALSTKHRNEVSNAFADDDDSSSSGEWHTAEAVGDEDVPAELLEKIKRMPPDVRKVVSFMTDGPSPIVDEIAELLAKGGPITRARAVSRLQALLGIHPTVDPVSATYTHFRGTP